MAITPTPNNNIYKGLVFDDIDSRDYGIYITGEAVFNSPERDVEMIEIPGRNGTYALDKGRFHNIEVTYSAGLFGGSEADFAAGIRAFRNALASRIGYKRLEDDYNPDEYRMAVYSAGLDVTPAQLKAGEFKITFDCKPQRFLKSGENEINVTSGQTVTNPTLFESRPLLETEGTGTINLNDDSIVITNNPIGNITLAGASTSFPSDNPLVVDTSLLLVGDTITLEAGTCYSEFLGSSAVKFTNVSNVSMTGDMAGSVSAQIRKTQLYINVTLSDVGFTFGNSATYTNTVTFSVTYLPTGGASTTTTGSLTITVSYDGANSFSFTEPTGASIGGVAWRKSATEVNKRQPITGVSSRMSIEGIMWFDLDIGEAWTEVGGTVVSVNNSVSFGADLPTLKSGANEITYDNTLSYLKITPRWWEV